MKRGYRAAFNPASPAEKSLLLYLETCVVDRAGRVDPARLNGTERQWIKDWCHLSVIRFGRIASEHVNDRGSMWVEFTPKAWTVAHKLRRERGERGKANRPFATAQTLET